jgi:hypothetical protein
MHPLSGVGFGVNPAGQLQIGWWLVHLQALLGPQNPSQGSTQRPSKQAASGGQSLSPLGQVPLARHP